MTNQSSLVWLDKTLYPFADHYFKTPAGRIHYVDEGMGDPIVMVHGNPSWSFGYRHLITAFSATHRCIAMDHLGFGLSDKPLDWTYLPQDHAANLEALLESLNLEKITLVVSDWGGPIGLSYALKYPDKVRRLVITNTWMWSVRDNWYYQAFSKFVGGPIGRHLIRTRNFFARDIVKAAFAVKRRLTPQIHQHYLSPLDRPAERKGSWVFPKQIIASSEWLASLWEQRAQLAAKSVLIAWGMKDIAFKSKELNRWIGLFPKATVVRFEDCGHYVAEEKPVELIAQIQELLAT